MSYTLAAASDVESVMDPDYGGMWFLRDALATDDIGVTILELEPGARGKEHDHASDGQEEVYVCVRGVVDVDFDDGDDEVGETVTLAENEAVRVSAEQTRQLQNRGDERAKLVLVGSSLE